MSGLGEPRGPQFHSPQWAAQEPPAGAAPAAAGRTARRWPVAAVAALAVIGVSAGTGGTAGGAVTVVGSDGRRVDAEVVGTDPASDIAVLRVSPSAALRRLVPADPNGTRVGEPVLAVGSPLGLTGTVTAGIVSALDRPVRLGGSTRQTAVQTDASINPGNSGGPLVNARGEVIGVNTAIATLEGGGSIGIGFAVPIERARQVADSLIARG